RPSWPRPTQWISSTSPASAGSVSSLMATATTRRPRRRAARATRNGKRPLPAMSPSVSRLFLVEMGAVVALQDHAPLRAAGEAEERLHLGCGGPFGLETGHGLAGVQPALEQDPIGVADGRDRLAAEASASQAEAVHPVDAGPVADGL